MRLILSLCLAAGVSSAAFARSEEPKRFPDGFSGAGAPSNVQSRALLLSGQQGMVVQDEQGRLNVIPPQTYAKPAETTCVAPDDAESGKDGTPAQIKTCRTGADPGSENLSTKPVDSAE